MRRFSLLLFLLLVTSVPVLAASPEAEVRAVIQSFQDALAERSVAKIEKLVAPELVALENGGRNDGWQYFRDHHLIPEFEHPMPPAKWEFIKVSAAPGMAWGYTRTVMKVGPPENQRDILLWSVFVLERRQGEWKIVLLDWSLKTSRPATAPPAAAPK